MGKGLTSEPRTVGTRERPQEGSRREGKVEAARAEEARRQQERAAWAAEVVPAAVAGGERTGNPAAPD